MDIVSMCLMSFDKWWPYVAPIVIILDDCLFWLSFCCLDPAVTILFAFIFGWTQTSDSRSCTPWKVVWLPFSEVSGSKQILDWWTVELAYACSCPATIFLFRMSCYATWILRTNHSGNILIVCRSISMECPDKQVCSVWKWIVCVCEYMMSYIFYTTVLIWAQPKWFKEDVADTCFSMMKRMYHHSNSVKPLVWWWMRSLNHLRFLFAVV